jgi:hypothetical protein
MAMRGGCQEDEEQKIGNKKYIGTYNIDQGKYGA